MQFEHSTDTCPKCGTEFVKIVFNTSPRQILYCPKCGVDKIVEPVEDKDGKVEKPPLGCKPAELVAWSRIRELTEAIYRQYRATNRNEKLVKRWANEITWHCALIESMKEEE